MRLRVRMDGETTAGGCVIVKTHRPLFLWRPSAALVLSARSHRPLFSILLGKPRDTLPKIARMGEKRGSRAPRRRRPRMPSAASKKTGQGPATPSPARKGGDARKKIVMGQFWYESRCLKFKERQIPIVRRQAHPGTTGLEMGCFESLSGSQKKAMRKML